jgi:hypothetical protein
MKKAEIILKKLLWVLVWVALGFALLFIIIVALIQFPAVQNKIVTSATKFVSNKTHTTVEIKRVGISLTGAIVVKGVFLEDIKNDTLLFADEAKVYVSLFDLLHSKLNVNHLELSNVSLNVSRSANDSLFNFNFLLAAFSDSTKLVKVEPQPKSKWTIDVGTIKLCNIRIRFDDQYGGIFAAANLNELELEMEDIDLSKSVFNANKLLVDGLEANVQIKKLTTESDKNTEAVLPKITANSIRIKNSTLNYSNAVNKQDITASINRLEVSDGEVDLQKQTVLVDMVSLSKSAVNFKTADVELPAAKTAEAINSTDEKNDWQVSVRSIKLSDNFIAYTVENRPEIKNGFDVNRIEYSNLILYASNFIYSPLKVEVSVKEFSAVDKNNFSVTQFETDFTMDQHSITADKLKVKTTKSTIDADLKLQYASLESLKDSLPFMVVNASINSIKIATADILYFSKQLANKPFFVSTTNVTTISGNVSGPVNSLVGTNLDIRTGIGTTIKTDFAITGLPKVQTAYFSFPNLRIVSVKHDIETLVGDSIPKNIRLPQNIALQIGFKGKLKAFETALKLNSSFGAAKLFATLDANENFVSNVTVVNFDLGMLLNDTAMFGPVSLTANVAGNGLTQSTLVAKIKAEVSQVYLNGYNYRNLKVDVSGGEQEFDGKISLNDENAVFDLTGHVNLKPNKGNFKLKLNLKGADLQKLKLTSDDIRISLVASANLTGGALNMLNGKAGISNIIIAKEGKIYELDSLLFASINETQKSKLNLRSALIGVNYSGTISPAELVAELSNFVNNYFPFSDSNKLQTKSKPSNFTFEIQLHNHPIISKVLLPQLSEFEPGLIAGSFNSENNQLALEAKMNRIVYGANEIDDLVLSVNSDSTALNYKVSSSAISNAQVKLDNFVLDGKIANKVITANVSSIDQNRKKKFEIHSQITKDNSNFKLSINPKDFYLMHNRWDIAADNYIEFGDEGFLFHNFLINNAESKIGVVSVNSKFNDDIKITINNFKLGDLSRIVEKDTSLVKGNVNGNVLLKRVNRTYGIIADAQIGNLVIREVPIGDLTLQADNPTAGRFNVEVNLSGTDNNLTANGYLLAKGGKSSINVSVNIPSLSMKTIEAFSMGHITEASGMLSGNFLVAGATSAPEVTGELVFSNAFIKPAIFNNRLELKHETIQFKTDGVYFKSFTLLDVHQHAAVISGSVKMKEFKNFVFDLQVNAKNFQLLNTTARDNKEFFGRMIIDSKIDINGPLAFPVISAKIKVINGSNFTFAIPESRLTTDKGEDVVEFGKSPMVSSILYRDEDKTLRKKGFTGFDLSTIVEIDKQATLRLLMDPSSSDSLVVRGEAALSFSIDRSGKMSLTGAYHLNDGSYLVSLESLVKRRFDIVPGSTIIWNGDPLDAQVAINAKYTVRAAPYDLLSFQMSSLSDAESGAYKQRYPFWVLLKLRGEILHPVINFEIQLPPEEKGILGGAVNQKLNLLNEDESALNKQVFALLVLSRFIQDNPLQTESTGASTLARATVGKLLSAQLNQLSSQLISGVELNFDIQSFDDYQTGQAEGRTQVEVGVKKQLFNDRLSVQVGGTVDVEGESAKQNTASEITGDVKVEYKLTKDGRYRLKGFRHNQYEGAIEGQLVETGVGVAYVRDFNRWKYFFRKRKTRRDTTSTNRNE